MAWLEWTGFVYPGMENEQDLKKRVATLVATNIAADLDDVMRCAVAWDLLTPDQISARLAQYLGGSRAAFYHIETLHLPTDAPGTMTLDRREPEKGEACEECKALASRGWQPAGVLPPPTSESRCRGHCKCCIERITVPLDQLAQYLGHPA